MMPTPDLVIDSNYVIIEGYRIDRPSRISVLQWLTVWERTRRMWEESH
jgi:hypothetical protein